MRAQLVSGIFGGLFDFCYLGEGFGMVHRGGRDGETLGRQAVVDCVCEICRVE